MILTHVGVIVRLFRGGRETESSLDNQLMFDVSVTSRGRSHSESQVYLRIPSKSWGPSDTFIEFSIF